jgi:hypothetical protein
MAPNYPIWGKATAITMKSQEYDDVPYYVNKVPWVMFFQAHSPTKTTKPSA